MALTLSQLRVGKADGKHEYFTPIRQEDYDTFDGFLVPDGVDPRRMHNGDIFYIEGLRGTGKTSLLRWHAKERRAEGAITDFVLFKTDLTDAERLHLSTEVGISWTDVDATTMEVAQDFKDAWSWFILHKIGENLRQHTGSYNPESAGLAATISRLLGLNDDNVFKKAIGFMPRLEGAHVKIRADIAFFAAELGGDFRPSGEHGRASLNAISKRVLARLTKLKLEKPIYVYFDELEAFYHTPEQHKRDQRMVRDLIFAVSRLNDAFRQATCNIHILAAVRSEVIDSMGALGQEVDRLVHDRGFLVSWHHVNRSISHPLMNIIAKKINISEEAEGLPISPDPLEVYFPAKVNEETIEAFLLDKSFYKPRDIVWRLSIAQKLFPLETKFTVTVLLDTEREYSSKLWAEIRYELGAVYSDAEVDAIEQVLSGGQLVFDLRQIEGKFSDQAARSPTLRSLLERRSVREILGDLYRLGAIGNSFRAGTTGTDIRNRWSFRGDNSLLPDKRMVIHSALKKSLSAVAERRRGSRSGRPSRQD